MDWLSGKKTYIIAACMVAYGIALYLQGQQEQALKVIFEALGLGALRAGVTKSGPGV
jgi:hypothetical protein